MNDETKQNEEATSATPKPSRAENDARRLSQFMEVADAFSQVGPTVDPHGFECGCVTVAVNDERVRVLNALHDLFMPREKTAGERALEALSPALIELWPHLMEYVRERAAVANSKPSRRLDRRRAGRGWDGAPPTRREFEAIAQARSRTARMANHSASLRT